MRRQEEKVEIPKMGMYDFQCVCGSSMAINGSLLQGHISTGMSYKCPNRLYQKCNRVYSAQFFKDHATYTAHKQQD